MAHIGVLEVLVSEGIEINCIAGVSMGALVGALYASGYSPAEIRQAALKTDWGDIFVDRPSRRTLFLNRKKTYGHHIAQIRFKDWRPYIPPAFTSGQKMNMFLEDLFMRAVYRPEPDFDHLKVPFRAVTTDIYSGEAYVFSQGEMAQAVRAAAAIPPVFSPVAFEGKLLVDGGAVENIPVFTVKDMRADIVIAVDVSSDLQSEVSEPWEIANQITTIMISEGMNRARKEADIVIKPLPDEIASFDFGAADSIPELGRRAAQSRIDEIKALLETKLEPDTVETFVFNHVDFILKGNLNIATEDKSLIETGACVSRNAVINILSRLYRKYELEDIRAEIEGDSIAIILTPAPSYRHIEINGNTLLPDSVIITAVHSPPGEPLRYSEGMADRERIIRLYRERSCALAKVRDTRLRGDTLEITIDEGALSEIKVEGGREMALRELDLLTGEPFDWKRTRRGLMRLYGTDLYETVRLKVRETESGYSAILALNRRPFPLVRLGERYDRERSWSVFAELVTEDVLGLGTGIDLIFAPGEKDKKASLGIIVDQMFGTEISYNAEISFRKNKYSLYDDRHHAIKNGDYDYERINALQKIGQNLRRWGLISAGLGVEKVLSSFPGEQPRDQRTMNFILESAVDTYDRYPFPNSGSSIRLTFQASTRFYPDGGEPRYSKFSGNLQRWSPLSKRYSAMLRLRGGYAEPTVPTWEKFSLGGMNDFAGLHTREILGNQLLTGSVALRFDLLSRFLAEAFITARYDFGQIVDGVETLELKRSFFRQGMSLTFSLNTLVGPAELSWGWAAPYKAIPYQHLLLFSIGHEF